MLITEVEWSQDCYTSQLGIQKLLLLFSFSGQTIETQIAWFKPLLCDSMLHWP